MEKLLYVFVFFSTLFLWRGPAVIRRLEIIRFRCVLLLQLFHSDTDLLLHSDTLLSSLNLFLSI